MSEVRATTGQVGWVGFASTFLLLAGMFNLVQGLVALIGSDFYYADPSEHLFLLDLTGWGWWNIVVAALLFITGVTLFTGATWARVVAVVIAGLNAIGQLLLVPAQPWWAFIVIGIDILIIYAVIVHGREMRSAEG